MKTRIIIDSTAELSAECKAKLDIVPLTVQFGDEEYLENNGYLVCESKSAKRYKSLLKLTDKGNEVGEIIADKIDYFLKEISFELSEQERIQFYHSLMLISKGLDNIANNKNGD